MELPINDKDLETILNALSLGGDARLYHLLKEVKQVRELEKEDGEGVVVWHLQKKELKLLKSELRNLKF